jgi:hypothetical protein
MIRFGINDTITNLQGFLQHENDEDKKEDGAKVLSKTWSIVICFICGIGLAYWGYGVYHVSFLEGIICLLFAALMLFMSLIVFLRARIDRKVAKCMHGSSQPVTKQDEPTRETVKNVPSFNMDVYEQNELPELPYMYAQTVSIEKNILNIKPVRILFFYNFHSSEEEYSKTLTMPGWTRLGTVYYLGSPTDISLVNTFSMHIKKKVDDLLIATEEKLKDRLETSTDEILPPGSKQLKSIPYFTGAYPEHVFLCTDNIWQQAVEALMNRVNIVLVDASDYNTKRSGLNWEFHQLTDNVSTSDFIILVNNYTDLPALGEALKTAWKNMSIHSPNNIAEPAPIKIVRLEKTLLTEVPEKFSELVPHLNNKNPLAGMGDQILKGNLLDCLQNDKIYGLLQSQDILTGTDVAAEHDQSTELADIKT